MRTSKYFSIGEKGTGSQILAAFKRVASPNLMFDTCERKEEALVSGAAKGFHDGYHAGVQDLLSRPLDMSNYYYQNFVFNILREIADTSNDIPADINLALAKALEETKKTALACTLYKAMQSNVSTESFIEALLQAGADPNASINGDVGYILVSAVSYEKPEHIIKLLHDKGARFDDAIEVMKNKSYYLEYLGIMREYQKKFESVAETTSRTSDLHDRVRVLEKQVERLTSVIENAGLGIRGEIQAPQKQNVIRLRMDK